MKLATYDGYQFVGKKIVMMEIDGFGIFMLTDDGTRLYYDAFDGGYSCWDIIKDEK